MTMAISASDGFQTITNLKDFDQHSGNALERLLFNYRGWIIAFCVLMTLLFAASATQVRMNASFLKTVPTSHPFILNYLEHQDELKGTANTLRIAVALKVRATSLPPSTWKPCG